MTTSPLGTAAASFMNTSRPSRCARNLPQHFNGCTCAPGSGGETAEVIDVDLSPINASSESLTAVIYAIEEDNDLDGHVTVTGENSATYDDPDGHIYDIDIEGTAIGVKVRYTDISNEAYAFFASPTATTAVNMVKKARGAAKDLDSFNAAASEWLSTTEAEKGIGYVEPEHDQEEGTIKVGGVTITGFTRESDWHHGPEMLVTVGDNYGSGDKPLTFTITQSKTGYADVFRGEDRVPLAHWEREALDSRVASLMNYSGYVRSLTELYQGAARRAIRGA